MLTFSDVDSGKVKALLLFALWMDTRTMDAIEGQAFSEPDIFHRNTQDNAPIIICHSKYQLAWADIFNGLKEWRLWLLLSWQDIKLRYRRSTLGPFWITISMAISVYSMGLLYGSLFKSNLTEYYPFLATGILSWGLISSLLLEGSNIFVEAEVFIKQMKQPYSVFVFRTIAKSLISFFHHLFVLVPILLLNKRGSIFLLFTLVSLAVIWLNGVIFGFILAISGTRFRDTAQLVANVVQIAFFLSPIIWSPSILPEKYHYIIQFNPFAQFIELLRNPLLGSLPSHYTLLFTLCISFIGGILAFWLFAQYRARIAYWL
jgi:lipopolysaccharide transport system permease protein